MDDDYIDLANKTLRHECCPGYCLKSKLVEGEVNHFCRFRSEDWELLNQSELIFEEVKTKKGTPKYVDKIVPGRNDEKMTQLIGWSPNIEEQI